jgi:hypothetical protein
MTEDQWLACTDPRPMLDFLHPKWRDCIDPRLMADFRHGETSERKSRLFACACARLVWHRLTAGRSRRAVETAERYADGFMTKLALLDAKAAAEAAASRAREREARSRVVVGNSFSLEVAAHATDQWIPRVLLAPFADPELCSEKHQDALADLIRDIYGNPFRPASLDPTWLTWRDGTIPRLAQVVYEDRQLPAGHLDASRLAVLADALEDAGCEDANLLAHCRGEGPHLRGCWVVDMLLGKE